MQCGAESRAYEASIGEQGVRSGDKPVVSGLVACAADTGVGVPHEAPVGPWADWAWSEFVACRPVVAPAEPWANNAWFLGSGAESRACEDAIRRRGTAPWDGDESPTAVERGTDPAVAFAARRDGIGRARADRTWTQDSDAGSRAYEAAIRRRGAAS